MIDLLGLQPIRVYQPNTEQPPGYDAAGLWVDRRWAYETHQLVIDPQSQAQFRREYGPQGEWTGGAIRITSTADVLHPVDDFTGTPPSWLEYQGRIYMVETAEPWEDPDFPALTCYCYTAVLMRPQPDTSPPPEPDPEVPGGED